MKFKVEDQYADKWVHGNLQEAPLPNCKLFKFEDKGSLLDGWEWWTTEVGSLEDLISLSKWKVENEEKYRHGCNIFINVQVMRIVFTTLDEPE